MAGWASLFTGNLSVPRAVLQQVGTFDPQFVTGGDVDLIRRISRAGYAFISDPALQVEHLKSYTLRSYVRDTFLKASGSVLLDLREGTLGVRRFMPVVNPATLWHDWRHFRALFGGTARDFMALSAALVLTRAIEVAGRIFYYRRFRRAGRMSPTAG
jgi:GT2 family glycosyltransferase